MALPFYNLEVWTTGAISPQEALAQAAKILRDHLVIFLNVVDEAVEKEQVVAEKEIPYFSQISEEMRGRAKEEMRGRAKITN